MSGLEPYDWNLHRRNLEKRIKMQRREITRLLGVEQYHWEFVHKVRNLRRTPNPAQIRADALLTDAARDVLAERARQVSAEGWTPEHDDAHGAGQMAVAAGCYAMFASVSDSERASTDLPGSLASLGKPIRGWAAWLQIWPWDRKWWKPTDRRRDLVKAAALILSEIERLDRATPLSPTAVDGSPAPDAGGKDDPAVYLIRKYGGYYRPNCQGYTRFKEEAGRYTLAKAISESHPNGPDGPRDGMTYIHEDDVLPLDAGGKEGV